MSRGFETSAGGIFFFVMRVCVCFVCFTFGKVVSESTGGVEYKERGGMWESLRAGMRVCGCGCYGLASEGSPPAGVSFLYLLSITI